MQPASTDPAPHKYNRAPIYESLAVQACRTADFACSSQGAKSHDTATVHLQLSLPVMHVVGDRTHKAIMKL